MSVYIGAVICRSANRRRRSNNLKNAQVGPAWVYPGHMVGARGYHLGHFHMGPRAQTTLDSPKVDPGMTVICYS